MVRSGVSRKRLSDYTGIPVRTLGNKINGKTEWRLGEMKKVKELFPGASMEFLFADARASDAKTHATAPPPNVEI